MTGSTSAVAQTQSTSPLESCSICLEPKNIEEGNLTSIEPCLHTFHTGCIEPWQNRGGSCPECRTPITFMQRLGQIGKAVIPIARPIVESIPTVGNAISNRIFERIDQAPTSGANGAVANCGKVINFVVGCANKAGVSAAVGAFGSLCLRNSDVPSNPKLVAIESLVGSAITSPLLIGFKYLREDRNADSEDGNADSEDGGSCSGAVLDIGLEALNAYIGNQILDHADVLPNAAAAAGATGAVTLPLAVIGGTFGIIGAGIGIGAAVYFSGSACMNAAESIRNRVSA